jgi:DNA-binding LacI/PurR family transcriptional regulator/DNA-binding transcriptional regulator YhcF (GntR family)
MRKNVSKVPKHRLAFETLREEILRGQHTNGHKLPSESQLVRRFAASRPTVAKALRDLQHEGLITRRAGSGSFVCGAPKVTAGDRFAVVVEGQKRSGLTIWGPVASQIANIAQERRHAIVLGTLPEPDVATGFNPDIVCEELIRQEVAGVFFKSTNRLRREQYGVNRQITYTLDAAGIAVVVLDFDVAEYPARSKFDVIGIDNRRAARLLADHLLDGGARRIDFVTMPLFLITVVDRMAGCEEAMRKRGIRPQAEWVHAGDPADRGFIRSLLQPAPPDAIVCANDETALRMIQGFAAEGVHVPQDVRVAGFDDVEFAALATPSLTTVRQPVEAMCRAAVQTMLQRIDEPDEPARDVLVDCQLIIRESSKS